MARNLIATQHKFHETHWLTSRILFRSLHNLEQLSPCRPLFVERFVNGFLRDRLLQILHDRIHLEAAHRISFLPFAQHMVDHVSGMPIEFAQNAIQRVSHFAVAAQHSRQRREALGTMLAPERIDHSAGRDDRDVPGTAVSWDRCQRVHIDWSEKHICIRGADRSLYDCIYIWMLG